MRNPTTCKQACNCRTEWLAEERLRMAGDLHDRVAQRLFALGLTADWLLTQTGTDWPYRPDLEKVKDLAASSLRELRDVIFSLSTGPITAPQFRAAVQAALAELESAGITSELRIWGDVQTLPCEAIEALYHVISEALVNVRRHSGATSVLVSVRIGSNGVTAVVQDDGCGLPPGVLETYRTNALHLGLRGMESRLQRLGGTLRFSAGDECGLIVTASIPSKGAAWHD